MDEQISTTLPTSRIQHCPQCQTELSAEQNFCPSCGAKIQEASTQPIGFVFCQSCGNELKPDTAFCPICGCKQGQPENKKRGKPSKKKKILLISICAAVVIAIATAISLFFAFRSTKKPDLEAIYNEYCHPSWAKLGDDKSYLSIDDNPYNVTDGDSQYFKVVNDAIKNIHKKLGLPDSLYEEMDLTSWSMGKQKEVFKASGVEVTWTYHPNYGLEITYKLINP